MIGLFSPMKRDGRMDWMIELAEVVGSEWVVAGVLRQSDLKAERGASRSLGWSQKISSAEDLG